MTNVIHISESFYNSSILFNIIDIVFTTKIISLTEILNRAVNFQVGLTVFTLELLTGV